MTTDKAYRDMAKGQFRNRQEYAMSLAEMNSKELTEITPGEGG